MGTNSQIPKRAIAYSFLAHVSTTGTFAKGPVDIFVPIVKNALSELYPDGAAKGANLSEIEIAIDDKFGLDIPTPVLRIIMLKIAKELNTQNGREDMTIFDDNAFVIKRFVFEEYKEQISRSRAEVLNVVKMFKEFCKIYKYNDGDETGLIHFIEQNRIDISYYLSHEQKNNAPQNVAAALFVDFFKKAPEIYDVLRRLYLGSMLTSYLNYEPTDVKMDVEILLDTNFIVSLLDLNTPESTKCCNIFIDASRKLGYKFTVLHDTIEEFQGLLTYKAQNLDSAVIAKNINKEDIYNACDRRNLSSVDLNRISDNIEEILTSQYGVYILPNTDKLKGKARYSKEYEIYKKYRSNEKSALHDAIAIQYVREKRGNKKIYDFDKVNCWFVNNAITHENEHDEDMEYLQDNKTAQPETIKVDNLLNIIWLSNPSFGVNNAEVVDVGLASMVSYALSATLPKSRIIKELDENIQKYRQDCNITDKDVLRLSTRIVNRQIEDVQSLNELARKDKTMFAAKVKEEAAKQEQIDNDTAQKLQRLINAMSNGIEELQQHRENQEKKHATRMEELENKEKELLDKQKNLDIKEKEFELYNGKLLSDNKTLASDNKEKNELLHNLWKQECRNRKTKRNELLDNVVIKEQRKSIYNLYWAIGVFVVFIIIVICVYCFVPQGALQIIDKVLENRLVSIAVSILISGLLACWNYIAVQNYNNWYNNPNYAKTKKETTLIPDELQDLSYDDFIKSIK